MMSAKLQPLSTVRELLKLYRVNALKNLSQNFLLDRSWIKKLVKAAGNIKCGEICEVGPGPGGLTRAILKYNPQKLVLVEKDKRFKPILENLEEAAFCDFKTIYADIMKLDMKDLFSSSLRKEWTDAPPNIHLIGNLPFNVSTPLIIQWLKDISLKRNVWSYGRVRMTLTFQEEVAERMVASNFNKERCRMSIMCQNYCKVRYKFCIPGKAFLPAPKVNVGVVHLEPLVEPIIPYDFHLIEKVLAATLNSKQQYLSNTVPRLFPKDLADGLVEELFNLSGIKPTSRGIHLSNLEWGHICKAYKTICDRDPRLYNYNYRGPISTRESHWMSNGSDNENALVF